MHSAHLVPTQAIVRAIPNSFSHAITHNVPTAPINVELAKKQHRQYVDTLRSLGLTIVELPAQEQLPDSCFVEDTAVFLDKVALITMPGALSRRAETQSVREVLSGYATSVTEMTLPATLDGGDCMRVGPRIYVGLSARTNQDGITLLKNTFAPLGFQVISVPLTDILHLKCVVSPLGSNRILLAEGTVAPRCFEPNEIVFAPKEEQYAANCISIGNDVIMPAGFPITQRRLQWEGYKVHALDMSEIRKADGSMTCSSILF